MANCVCAQDQGEVTFCVSQFLCALKSATQNSWEKKKRDRQPVNYKKVSNLAEKGVKGRMKRRDNNLVNE